VVPSDDDGVEQPWWGLGLVPHQLFFTSIPRWCGTSARGAGPPSALGVRLAEHPPGVKEPLPYNPSVPLAEPWGA
jgi:hypothetical protein